MTLAGKVKFSERERDHCSLMTLEQVKSIHRAGLVCAVGLFLLYVVFLVPHPGYSEGKSFFMVAHGALWQDFGDWAAAWCSMKIILLSAGIFVLLVSLGAALQVLQRETVAASLFVLAVSQVLMFLFGFYCLIKSVL